MNVSEDVWVVRTGGDVSADAEAVLEGLQGDRHLVLESAEEWDEFAEMIRASHPRTIVAAGGDGTVNGVVRALGPGSDTCLGIVPLGTGNDFARGLGLPTDPEDAASVVRAGHVAHVDLLSLAVDDDADSMEVSDAEAGEIVVNAVTVGLSGAIHAELDDELKARWGRFAYIRAALTAAAEMEPFEAVIEVVREESPEMERLWSGGLLHVSFANGPTAGGGVPLAPEADPADGLLELCGVAEGTVWEVGSAVPGVLSEGPSPEPWLVESVRAARLTLPEPMQLSVDGDTRRARVIALRVLPRALKVHIASPFG